MFFNIFFFQEWEEMSNSAFTVVQLPVLKGLGNTVQTAQTQRPDPGDGWAADIPLPPKMSMRGYAEGAEPGDPSLGVPRTQHLPGQDLPVCICITGLTSPFRCLLVLSLLVFAHTFTCLSY